MYFAFGSVRSSAGDIEILFMFLINLYWCEYEGDVVAVVVVVETESGV